MASIEERVSRPEGEYGHLASKADIEELRGEIKTGNAQLEARLVKWMVNLMLGATVAATALATLIERVT